MSAKDRRKLLIEDMQNLEARGISCLGCSGVCCTETANSMMVTPVEIFDLFAYLSQDTSKFPELKIRMQAAVDKYKLDILPPGIKKKSQFRRTYTCPFFLGSEFGCPLPREFKPYGCLGFNRQKKEATVDEDCWSNKEVLVNQGALNNEKEINEWIAKELKLSWDKEYLPIALIEFINMFTENDDPQSSTISPFEDFFERASQKFSA